MRKAERAPLFAVTAELLLFLLQEEVLMVQEAKQDCYKQWYLPAGRVEVGESLEEALRREVSPAAVVMVNAVLKVSLMSARDVRR